MSQGIDDRFFRKINKNLPSASGPLINVELKEASVVVYVGTSEAIDLIYEGIIKRRDFQCWSCG